MEQKEEKTNENKKKGKDTSINNKEDNNKSKGGKNNKKEWKNTKQQNAADLEEEMKGFLIFTDKHREKNCTRDTYNILNDVVEKLYPNITNDNNGTNMSLNEEIKPNDNNDTNENISSKIEDEIKNLKKRKNIFSSFNTRCAATVFIKIEKSYSEIISPKEITSYIIKEVIETKKPLSKLISKFYPIEICTKYTLNSFKEKVDELVNKYFTDHDEGHQRTWKIELRVRNNSSVNKKELMGYILGKINKEKYVVEYKNPELTFLVEISCNIMCLSVLEKFAEYKSYNIHSLAKTDEELNNEKTKLMKLQNESKTKKENTKTEKAKEEKEEKEEKNISKNDEIELPKDDDEIDLI